MPPAGPDPLTPGQDGDAGQGTSSKAQVRRSRAGGATGQRAQLCAHPSLQLLSAATLQGAH